MEVYVKKEKNLRTFSLFLMLMFLSWGCQIDNGNNESSNESKKVTLTYYANGVYGEKTETVDYGTGIIIPACPFSKKGYSFVKWSEDPNNSTSYSSRLKSMKKFICIQILSFMRFGKQILTQ